MPIQVEKSDALQLVIHRSSSHGFGDFVTVVYPDENPDDRFDSHEIVEVIKVQVNDIHTNVTRLICTLEEFSDGLPISALLEHIIRELLIQKGLLKS